MQKKFTIPIIIILLAISFLFLYSKEISLDNMDIISTLEDEVYNYAIYTEDGDILYTDKILSTKKNLFNNIILEFNGGKTKNPLGILENPPSRTIMDTKDIALDSLTNGKKILIIYIDGLGYELYEKALALDIIPYMSSLDKAERAITTYPPITDVTFASMVTGETPKYTGIHNRDKKPMKVDSVFEIAAKEGFSSKVIEGDMRILTCDVETVLHIDENKDGFIDDDIYRYALKEIVNPTDILLIHFHSFDDMAHLHGPESKEALDQLKVLDGYVKDIMEIYNDDVVIVSDHGMHDVESGGNHGTFCSEDIFIPIIIKK